MKILMVVTSHDTLGTTGQKTGFWLEEFAAPYYVFTDAGAEVTVASPLGGHPPIDPKSDQPEHQTAAMARFKRDATAQHVLAHTRRLSEMTAAHFDAVFYPGGHGPLWDLAEDRTSIALIESFYAAGKPVGAVCHAPAVLRHVTIDGQPLVRGKRVTGFTNSEEAAVQLTTVVPFLVEDELKRLGGRYEQAADWASFAITDGRLVTGQNPASSTASAEALLALHAAQPATKSLYERLGGVYSIATVVDDFIERLLVNDTLNANPAISEARGRVPKAGLKFHVTALICEGTGGPCKYSGRSMKESHDRLNINEAQWRAMVADFRKTLDKFEVPTKEKEDLITIVGGTKKDIVKPASY